LVEKKRKMNHRRWPGKGRKESWQGGRGPTEPAARNNLKSHRKAR